VVTVKVPLVVPAGMLRLAGTVAEEVRLLARVTTEPPAGAGPESSTVPVEGLPPATVLGVSVTDKGVGDGTTVKVVVLIVVEGQVPEIVTTVSEVTAVVAIEKLALDKPAVTVMLAGTLAAPLLLDSTTTAPPAGAVVVR
jgi:hypothetical protein